MYLCICTHFVEYTYQFHGQHMFIGCVSKVVSVCRSVYTISNWPSKNKA